jgi:hypothetical protein
MLAGNYRGFNVVLGILCVPLGALFIFRHVPKAEMIST